MQGPTELVSEAPSGREKGEDINRSLWFRLLGFRV